MSIPGCDDEWVSDPFVSAVERARAVRRVVERDLSAYAWAPTSAERQISIDVARATKLPAVRGGPPYVTLPVWERLLRLAPWAAAIRLGMAAGGWQLAEEGPPQAASAAGPVDLPALLIALYGPARMVERWSNRMDDLGMAGLDEDQAAAKLAEEVPNLGVHLAEAERFFDGLGSVGLTLSVIWNGDVDI